MWKDGEKGGFHSGTGDILPNSPVFHVVKTKLQKGLHGPSSRKMNEQTNLCLDGRLSPSRWEYIEYAEYNVSAMQPGLESEMGSIQIVALDAHLAL